MAVDVGEAHVSRRKAKGALGVVDAKEVEHGGVEVVYVDFVFYSLETEVIGRSVNISSLDSAACHPGGEAIVVVVAPVDLAGIGSFLGHFDDRSSAKFSSSQDEGFVEHSALF